MKWWNVRCLGGKRKKFKSLVEVLKSKLAVLVCYKIVVKYHRSIVDAKSEGEGKEIETDNRRYKLYIHYG